MANSIRVISRNIRSGGGERGRSIADAIAKHNADIAILIEYRPQGSVQLLNQLEGLGYEHRVLSTRVPHIGGVAILSRRPIVEESCLRRSDPFDHESRWRAFPTLTSLCAGSMGHSRARRSPTAGGAFSDQ